MVKNRHNHAIRAPALLKYRDVSIKTQESLRQLFENGHSPSSAYHILQSDAFIEFGEDYDKMIADRNQVPDMAYCYNMFYKEFKEKLGPLRRDHKVDLSRLQCKLDQWCMQSNGTAIAEVFNDDIIVCIMTPLMHRVHSEISQSEQILFVSANGNSNRIKHRIYFLYTRSIAGELPVGYIIISSKKQESFERALQLYCLLDVNCTSFYGRGSFTGPDNIITDNDLAEINSLKIFWSNSNVLLCSTYVLKDVWKWILETKHNIHSNDRNELFFAFKRILTATNNENAVKYYQKLKHSEITDKYPHFYNYINSIWWPLKELWCTCYRSSLPISSSRINNYIEYAVRALKDIILKHTKVFNLVQHVGFILSRFDKYYCRMIVDLIKSGLSISHMKKFLPDTKDFSAVQVIEMENGDFIIRNTNEDCIVDINLGLCTCNDGLIRVLCKHHSAVILYKGIGDLLNIENEEVYQRLLYVATGQQTLSTELNKQLIFVENNIDNENDQIDSLQDIAETDMPILKITSTDIENESYTNVSYVFDDILQKIQISQSSEMLKAANTFCNNYKKFSKDESLLQLALKTFGYFINSEILSSSLSSMKCQTSETTDPTDIFCLKKGLQSNSNTFEKFNNLEKLSATTSCVQPLSQVAVNCQTSETIPSGAFCKNYKFSKVKKSLPVTRFRKYNAKNSSCIKFSLQPTAIEKWKLKLQAKIQLNER